MRWVQSAGWLLVVAACSGGAGGAVDGGPADVAAPDAAACLPVLEPSDLELSDPEDFDHVGCAPGGLHGFDPTGVWHYLQFWESGHRAFHGALRFTRDASGCPTARLDGLAADVHLTLDDLLVRQQFYSMGEVAFWMTYHACSSDIGRIQGSYAECLRPDAPPAYCSLGTFEAVKLLPIPGEGIASGVEKLGEWRGEAELLWTGVTLDVRALGGIAYVVRREDGLRIVDVSDPSAPREVAWLPPVAPYEWYLGVELLPRADGRVYALALSDTRGLVVFDVTDPAMPAEIATAPTPLPGEIASGHALALEIEAGSEARAYLIRAPGWTSGDQYLDVIDVSAPATPLVLGTYHPTPGLSARDLAVADRRLHLVGGSRFELLDANDPTSVISIGLVDGPVSPLFYNARSVSLANIGGCERAVVVDQSFAGATRVIGTDEACPDYLRPMGMFTLRPEVAATDVRTVGDLAFVAHNQDGLRVLDVSDSTNPIQVSHYNTWTGGPGDSFSEGARGVDVDPVTGYVYVADSHGGLVILRVMP